MPSFQDLTGYKFGRLTVVERSENLGKKTTWLCKCECSSEVVVRSHSLKIGETRSCGCLQVEESRARLTTHGLSKLRSYDVWLNMLSRCENPEDASYFRYGGRGITVCERWKNLENFLEDMGEAPEGLTLDRVNNNEGYSKENCRWATPAVQMRNNRRNRFLTHAGKTQCLMDWAMELGVGYETLYYRLKRGWSVDRTLSTPI